VTGKIMKQMRGRGRSDWSGGRLATRLKKKRGFRSEINPFGHWYRGKKRKRRNPIVKRKRGARPSERAKKKGRGG